LIPQDPTVCPPPPARDPRGSTPTRSRKGGQVGSTDERHHRVRGE